MSDELESSTLEPEGGRPMSVWKLTLSVAIVAVLAGAWYLFRPELLFVNREVHEEFPASRTDAPATRAKVLAVGEFHGVAHTTMGTATVHETTGGSRVLRLTNFETSNGPAVHVYLIAAADANDADSVKNAQPIDLGEMKGNKGDQNYDVPAAIDLAKYRAVTIWCARFDVNFATAPLAPPAS
jgi:Electron transfer DM13